MKKVLFFTPILYCLPKGTAAGIYDLRRLKIKRCAELDVAARLRLTFTLSSPEMSIRGFSAESTTPNVQVTKTLRGLFFRTRLPKIAVEDKCLITSD